MKTIEELDQYISKNIQGVFSPADMRVLKEEIEKLEEGDVYLEIGVDEGRSARVAHEYAKQGVYKIFIDIHDPQATEGISIGRAKWMEQEEMVGLNKTGFYIHGDADQFANLLNIQRLIIPFISLLFLDPHHDYESIRKNTLNWEPFVKYGGTILFHDTDHVDTRQWLNDHYGKDKWEELHGKIARVKR